MGKPGTWSMIGQLQLGLGDKDLVTNFYETLFFPLVQHLTGKFPFAILGMI